jgi:Ca2+-binding RTX toxin-like protein
MPGDWLYGDNGADQFWGEGGNDRLYGFHEMLEVVVGGALRTRR